MNYKLTCEPEEGEARDTLSQIRVNPQPSIGESSALIGREKTQASLSLKTVALKRKKNKKEKGKLNINLCRILEQNRKIFCIPSAHKSTFARARLRPGFGYW